MNNDSSMEKSLQGYSEFVSFDASKNASSLQQSLCGVSQKILIPNASQVNRQELQKDKREYEKYRKEHAIEEQIQAEDDEQVNQFLTVGKWNKNKSKTSDNNETNASKKSPGSVVKKDNQSKVKSKNSSEIIHEGKQHKNKSKVSANEASKLKKLQESQYSQAEKSVKNITNDFRQKNSSVHSNLEPSIHINKSTKPLTVPVQPHWHPHGKKPQDQPQAEQEQEEDEEESQEQQEESEQQQEESSSEQQQQQESQESEEEEDQQIQQEEEQEEEQQKEQDKFKTGLQDDRSSQAFQTQIANTSALNHTPKNSKWAKKKPLETMTKYQGKVSNQQNTQEKKAYHTRLNSATYQTNVQGQNDEIVENMEAQNGQQEWTRMQKILFRMKMLIG